MAMQPKNNPARNLPKVALGHRPFSPSSPAQRGDTGKGPMPRCADGRESRHVKPGGKSGR